MAKDIISVLAVIAMRAGASEEQAIAIAEDVMRRWNGVYPVTIENTQRLIAEVEEAAVQ